MLHVPIPQMTDQNDFYLNVKKYLRRHIIDMIRNPYLTEKNKKYLLILTIAPRITRKVHKAKKEKELARELEKESERESS